MLRFLFNGSIKNAIGAAGVTYILYRIAKSENSPLPLSWQSPFAVNGHLRNAIERGDVAKVKYFVNNAPENPGIMPNYIKDDPRTPSCLAADSYAKCLTRWRTADCGKYVDLVGFLANRGSVCYPHGATSTIHSLAALDTDDAVDVLRYILTAIMPHYKYVTSMHAQMIGDPVHYYIEKSRDNSGRNLLEVAKDNPQMLAMLQELLAKPATKPNVELDEKEIELFMTELEATAARLARESAALAEKYRPKLQ